MKMPDMEDVLGFLIDMVIAVFLLVVICIIVALGYHIIFDWIPNGKGIFSFNN